MPVKTKIEWADYVSNPLRAFVSSNPEKDGCACVRKSEGCAHCWASRFNGRLGTGLEYTLPNLRTVTPYIRQHELTAIRAFKPHVPFATGYFKNQRSRPLVFMCDMTDLFGEWVSDQDIRDVFEAMADNSRVDFVVLTKRPERANVWLKGWTLHRKTPSHIWIGASVENSLRAKERMEPLKMISQMGFKTLVSYEPALSAVEWELLGYDFINWLICGGESGPGARPMSARWAEDAQAFCKKFGIAYFFKQWGEHAPVRDLVARGFGKFTHRPQEVDGVMMAQVGKGQAGHSLNGQEWRAVPV